MQDSDTKLGVLNNADGVPIPPAADFHRAPDLSFFVAIRAASALRSCFFSTPSISSGNLFGVQPKQGTRGETPARV